MTEEQKARLAELKAKGELTAEEKTELASLNTLSTGKTYTQDEVSGLITKKTREAQEKLLKDLGIDTMDNLKDGLSKLKDLQDKDKTDLEKATSTIEELTTQINTLKAGNSASDIKVALLSAGVKGDDLGRYTKLYGTYEGETVEDNIKSLMEEFPIQAETGGTPPPALPGKTGGASTEKTMEEMQAEVDSIAGVQ